MTWHWYWWDLLRSRRRTPSGTPLVQARLRGGEQAKREATKNLAVARAKGPEVSRIASTLRELRERNHFQDQLEAMIRGSNP